MDDELDPLELQRLNRESELAMQKLKEANLKLRNIQKECSGSSVNSGLLA